MAKKLSPIQKETLKHYDRMIRWAKKQNSRRRVKYQDMLFAIEEGWEGDHCPYCKVYYIGRGCDACPLSPSCCGDLWGNMNQAKTWGKWIEKALRVRQYIKANG